VLSLLPPSGALSPFRFSHSGFFPGMCGRHQWAGNTLGVPPGCAIGQAGQGGHVGQ
jgi:hypothetical protein